MKNPLIRRSHSGVTVWACIGHYGVVGTFLFDGNVSARRYLAMLQDNVIPALQQRPNFDQLVFMQDGAPPHWGLVVRALLNLRSPFDFCWGYVKSLVYTDQPQANLNALRERITDEMGEIPQDMIDRAMKNMLGKHEKMLLLLIMLSFLE